MTHPTLMDDPGHWLDRAEEARRLADQLSDPYARSQMLETAAGYERLAERARNRMRARDHLGCGPLRDQRGAVAVYASIPIALLVGLGMLAIDLPRMASFTTDLQNAADAAALAGAWELDGQPGAQKFGSATSSAQVRSRLIL